MENRFINDELYHHGVLGMRWGVRNLDTKARYAREKRMSPRKAGKTLNKIQKKIAYNRSASYRRDDLANEHKDIRRRKKYYEKTQKKEGQRQTENVYLRNASKELEKYVADRKFDVKVKDITIHPQTKKDFKRVLAASAALGVYGAIGMNVANNKHRNQAKMHGPHNESAYNINTKKYTVKPRKALNYKGKKVNISKYDRLNFGTDDMNRVTTLQMTSESSNSSNDSEKSLRQLSKAQKKLWGLK